MTLFDLISPVYTWFFNTQEKHYKDLIKHHFPKDIQTTLDIGCGTGAFCSALYDHGVNVVGIEPSKGMIRYAKKNLKGKEIELIHDFTYNYFPEHRYDAVFASFVLHGMKPNERNEIYKDMMRLSNNYVILHEYSTKRRLLTDIIEFLEGGDYFNFIKVVKNELDTHFKLVEIVEVRDWVNWYIYKVR